MKVLSRFVIPSLIILTLLALATVPVVQHLTKRWFDRDLDLRSRIILTTIQEAITPLLASHAPDQRIPMILNRVADADRVMGIAICSPQGEMIAQSHAFPSEAKCPPFDLRESASMMINNTEVHRATAALYNERGTALGTVVILHDRSFIARRADITRNYLVVAFLLIGITTTLLAFATTYWSRNRLITRMRKLMRSVLHRKDFSQIDDAQFMPIVKDLRRFVKELQQSSQGLDGLRATWSAKAIKEILSKELLGDEIIVVSNRQPYSHIRRASGVEIQSPASGLVTAVEPIVKACSGTWIAHGSGDADREYVDKNDHVAVPPGNPEYQLHRIWLTKSEEDHYYYGFANEGLWPLCHIAYTRPTFRKSDWDTYVEVNRKFADAVVRDAKQDDPVVLVHDYHFALVPKFLRERLPKATIITFWHIPWPNAETFGICPWQKEILEGLLGSSIIGFHTQFHCNNFIECVDRVLESRIDRETNAITYQGNISAIRSYPISIEWPPSRLKDLPDVATCRAEVLAEFGLNPDVKLAVGVDRLDYTKGIIERFRAVERVLELSKEWRGRLTLLQIAAPSRTSISAYKRFHDDVIEMAERINQRFGSGNYQPIKLVAEHREPVKVLSYLRASDVCLVTSLHDGMNLVAKEFVAARDDEKGVLVLSVFTGASRELIDALIVNPYDIEQTARAVLKALSMPVQEQRERMRLLRGVVKDYNVYRWAGRMLLDAAVLRRRQRYSHHVANESAENIYHYPMAPVIPHAPSIIANGAGGR